MVKDFQNKFFIDTKAMKKKPVAKIDPKKQRVFHRRNYSDQVNMLIRVNPDLDLHLNEKPPSDYQSIETTIDKK